MTKKILTTFLVIILLTLTGCSDSAEDMEIQEYANKVNQLISDFVTAKIEFEDFFDGFNKNLVAGLSQFRGNNWKQEIEKTMDEINEVINSIKELEAPEAVMDVHEDLILVLEKLEQAKNDIIKSYEERDMLSFARALQSYQDLLDDLIELTKAVQELLPESERINFESYLQPK